MTLLPFEKKWNKENPYGARIVEKKSRHKKAKKKQKYKIRNIDMWQFALRH